MKCPNGFICVPPDGPSPCEILVVGEAPGKVESHTLVPLTGPTGLEFNQTYLPLAGLRRENIRVINTVNHVSTINRKPTEADIRMCVECRLKLELLECNPRVVILMGATACSLVPEIDLETQHGIPFKGTLFGREYWLVPMWHPALGLHRTSAMTDLLRDWEGLRVWLEDGLDTWPVDERQHEYGLISMFEDLEEYNTRTIAFSNPPWVMCGIDTETHGGQPYSIQFSVEPGTARMLILEGNDKLVKDTVRWINHAIREGMQLVFHNAPADLPLVMQLGINGFRWRDTMQEAYHLGYLPQALKALSYRLLGCKRQSWAETVTPDSLVALGEWINEAIVYARDHYTVVEERTGKRGQALKPKVTRSHMERVLVRIMNHMWNETYNPWERIQEDVLTLGWKKEEVKNELPPMPVKGIAHCSLEEQIAYACADADDTLTVAMLFDELRKYKMFDILEDDCDAIRRN